MDGFFVFNPVSKTLVEQLMGAKDADSLRRTVMDVFALTGTDEPTELLVDFHIRNFSYARQSRFTLEKTSCFLGLMNHVFHSSLDQRMTQTASYESFRRNVLKHSTQRPPWSLLVFSAEDVQKLTAFAQWSFFRNYALYEHAFTPHTDMLLITGSRFQSSFPPVQQLGLGKSIDPTQMPQLSEYLTPPAVEEGEQKEEQANQSLSEKEESVELDPLQQLLNQELKALEANLDEKMRKREEDLVAKMQTGKK
jgi:septin family protein